MKTSIFLTSFFSRNCNGSKPMTSPAMRGANCDASNLVIVRTPLWPAHSARQFASVPMPSDDTRPMPVTTTRRLLVMINLLAEQARPLHPEQARPLLLRFGVGLDVLDRFLHARAVLRILVRDLDPELLLERHHQFDGVE